MEGGDTWAFDPATPHHPYFHINGTSDGNGDAGPIQGASLSTKEELLVEILDFFDLVLGDGFGSGDTAAWSSTVP